MTARSLTAGRAAATLALILGAVVLIFLTRAPPRYDIVAEFSNVQGLVPGAQVELAGVTVGEVQSIRLGSDGYPRVRMAIDNDVTMRANGTAAVRLLSLSGEFSDYVSIVQGTGARLHDGAVLDRQSTTWPRCAAELLRQARRSRRPCERAPRRSSRRLRWRTRSVPTAGRSTACSRARTRSSPRSRTAAATSVAPSTGCTRCCRRWPTARARSPPGWPSSPRGSTRRRRRSCVDRR